MRVSDLFQNLDFSGNSVKVHLVFDFILFKYFYGDFFLCDGLDAQFDFSKSPFTESFVNQEIPDLFPFLRFWFDLPRSQNQLFEKIFLLL